MIRDLRLGTTDGTSPWRDEQDFDEARALTKLLVARQFGPKPWPIRDQHAAVVHAGDILASLTMIDVTRARRQLAVEFLALASTRGRPQLADWLAAVMKVDASDDHQVALMARGGLSPRASLGGWDRRPAPPSGGSPLW
jgi:hypothetical protein